MKKNECTQSSLPKHLRAWHQNSKVYENAYGEDIEILDCTLFGESIEFYDAYLMFPEKSFFCDYDLTKTFYIVISFALYYKQALNLKRNRLNSWLAASVIKNHGHKVAYPEYTNMTWKQLVINAHLHKLFGRKESEVEDMESYQDKAINSLCPAQHRHVEHETILELDDLEAGGKLTDDSHQRTIDVPLSNSNTEVNHLSIEHRFIAFG